MLKEKRRYIDIVPTEELNKFPDSFEKPKLKIDKILNKIESLKRNKSLGIQKNIEDTN